MDMGWITNNIGAITGGFVVIAVAYFLFRPRSNNNQSEKSSNDSATEKGKKSDTKELVDLSPESDSRKETSPLWKTRRYMLSKMRSLKKPDILPAKNREDMPQIINNKKEELPAMIDVPVADPVEFSLDTLEENSEVNVENIPEIPLPVPIEDPGSFSGEIDDTNFQELTDNDSSPEIYMNTVTPPDETEEIDKSQLEVAAMDYEQLSEKPEGGSNVFSLFTDEDDEENEISKFASSLDQVDVNNLLKEAENIKKYLRR